MFKLLKCGLTQTQTFKLEVLQLFLWDVFIVLNQFPAGSCSVKMSQVFHNPLINLHTWERYTCLKLLECVLISTQTFEANDSQLFLLDLFLILSKIPKLTVK